MLLFRFKLFLLIFLQTFIYIFSNASNEDMTKAMSCMSLLIQIFKGKSPDQKKYSSMLLKCFITITEEESKEIFVGLEQGKQALEPEEIERLTNFSTLSNFSKNELDEYSYKLQNAINTFKKMQDNYQSGKKDNDYDNDEEFKKTHPSRGNSLGSFMKKMTGLLKTINNMGSVVLILIFLYFGFIMFKKFCGKKKK